MSDLMLQQLALLKQLYGLDEKIPEKTYLTTYGFFYFHETINFY